MVSTGQRSSSEGDVCSQLEVLPVKPSCTEHESSEVSALDSVRRRFQLGRRLGRGTYGSVRLAKERCSGRLVALKSVYKRNVHSQQDLQRVRDEASIMSSLDHPNILKVLDVMETSSRLVLVLEYAAGGELFERLVSGSCHEATLSDESSLESPLTQQKRWFSQLASAVQHCHERGVVHRDLKLENILLDENDNVKLGDFGLATHFSSGQKLSAYCGSALYASPEVINARPYIGPELDCWSLGVVLFTLVHGCMPFGGEARELRVQITTGSYFEPQRMRGASDIISGLLQPDPEVRDSVDDVMASMWLQEERPIETVQQEASDRPAKSSSGVVSSDTRDSGVGMDSSRPSSTSSESSELSLSDLDEVCDEVYDSSDNVFDADDCCDKDSAPLVVSDENTSV